MAMIKCIIIDDEQASIDILSTYISKISFLELIATATNPLDGIELVKLHKADLLLLDIHMDEMSGLDVMRVLDGTVKVILCTAYSEFAIESYELSAVDYLMKPVPFDRFLKAVKKVKPETSDTPSLIAAVQDDYSFVKLTQKGKMIRLNYSDIDYIEARNNYVAIFKNGSAVPVLVYAKLSDMENNLLASDFIRVHKSFIVAAAKIFSVDKNTVQMYNSDVSIPLGRNYRDNFMKRISNKIINRDR